MSSMKTPRNRKARQDSRSSLQLECLESRLPLAGNVTAQLVGSTLFLTGDALGNELVVASAKAGTIAVLGNGTTINGAATPFVTTKPVTNIVANLNGGNDFIGFSNDATGLGNQLIVADITLTPAFDAVALQDAIDNVAGGVTTFSLPGSLTVTTGDGDDAVGIIGNVGGSVAVNLGSAIPGSKTGNVLGIGNPDSATLANRIGGGLSVVGGSQDDAVGVRGTSVAGAVSVALGNNGYNGLEISDSSIGSLTYVGGSGYDLVHAASLTVRNGVSVSTGAGKDYVYLHTHGGPLTVVGGGLVIDTGADDDYVELVIDARRTVSVTTGGGNDEVRLEASKVGLGLAINTGDGNDTVGVVNTYVDQNAVIDTGAGNDVVGLANSRIRYNLFAYLGAGNDSLNLEGVSALAAYLYGGTGANTLTLDPTTRAGIRTLRYYQFLTVNNTVPG